MADTPSTSQMQPRLRLGRRQSLKSAEERTEGEFGKFSRSFERSISPKFILDKKIKMPGTLNLMKFKPVFSKLEKKTLAWDGGQTKTTANLGNPSFQGQLKNFQCFTKPVKKQSKDTITPAKPCGIKKLIPDAWGREMRPGVQIPYWDNLPVKGFVGAKEVTTKKVFVISRPEAVEVDAHKSGSLIPGSKTSVENTATGTDLRDNFQMENSVADSPLRSILKKGPDVRLWKGACQALSNNASPCASPGKKVSFSPKKFLRQFTKGSQEAN